MLLGKDIGPFHIEKELGSGAMGSVYQAVFRETGQRVAFKIIGLAQLGNETAIARFEREGKILKQLKHPNITRLIATGHYKKTPFFAMELVEGESLDKVLARRGSYSWEEVVALGKQLCAALQHAHMKGIIHRDLKPSNVMVLPDGTVKLTDFGIAKDMDVTALTGANSTVGTAAYMSPEQCRGEKNIGPKSDLYSMGVMFYELLTGRKPFVAESPVDMFLMHVNAEPVRAGKLVLSIPTWLDTLVDQLMAKKPEHRPLDAAMVAKALEEVEEKAIKQQSAGVDAVTARRVDRPGRAVEDADREAARALRSALTRKKIRKKSRRSNPEVWFRAGGLIALLLGIVGVIYFMTKPLSAEKYYEMTKVAVDSRDEDQVIKLTQRFVEIYPKADDAHAQEIRAWRREFRAAQREKQLFNRFDKKLQALDSDLQQDKDAWRLSANAFRYENDGDIDNARRVWLEMEEAFQGAPDPEPAVYGWVAKKKSDDLVQLDSRATALRAVLDEQRLGRRLDFKPESEPERLALTALRYQEFGDLPAARDRWAKIRDQYLKPIDVRPWGILAAQRAAQLKTVAVSGQDKEHDFRLGLLARKWTQANAATMNSDPTEKRQAGGTCRDLIELYGKDPDPAIAAYGERAQQKLRDIGGF